jgi:large subunit ribosomal protein L4
MKRLCRVGVPAGPRLGLRLSTAAKQLPPNLQLADLAVLEPPVEDIVKPIEYLFPSKNPPSSIPVHSFQDSTEPVDSAPLDKRVFGVAIRQDIIHQIVRYQRAKIRQPQCTKGISEQRGSTRKLYAQKGSGRARVGMARVPGRRGGPKAHGPVLRDFSFSLNRKMRAMGMMIALAAKHREGNLIVFDKLECEVRRSCFISLSRDTFMLIVLCDFVF